jgi:DGQHR domain-containing protein
MANRRPPPVIVRRALLLNQTGRYPLYSFSLTGEEILQIADISRVARDEAGELIGYQRPAVRRHIQEIVEYLDSDEVLFPNPIILALSSSVKFRHSRGPNVSDGFAAAGTLEIPVPQPGRGDKPGWIVDGQQRALALSMAERKDFPVPVNAFVADSVEMQRDQFLRVNNTKPLPRGLVAELLPTVTTSLPPRLALSRTPSALCDLLSRDPASPFYELIRRPSSTGEKRKQAVVSDTALIGTLQESLSSASGCLFPYRNMTTGETDFDGIWAALVLYWGAVRDTFPEAWGKPPARSRLMHSAGIRAMGRLMDKVLSSVDARESSAERRVREDLALVAPHCHWTEGHWEGLGGLRWDEVQNVPRHVRELSSFLVRVHLQVRRAA